MPSRFNPVRLFATPWTVTRQAPLSMGFPREEYWSGLLNPPPGMFPTQGLNPHLFCLLRWQSDSLLLVPPGNPRVALNNTNVSYSSGGQKSEMGLQDKIKVSAELHYFGSSKNLLFALCSFWRCSRYLAHITLLPSYISFSDSDPAASLF